MNESVTHYFNQNIGLIFLCFKSEDEFKTNAECKLPIYDELFRDFMIFLINTNCVYYEWKHIGTKQWKLRENIIWYDVNKLKQDNLNVDIIIFTITYHNYF